MTPNESLIPIEAAPIEPPSFIRQWHAALEL